jgi:hypothetical protein
MTRNLLKCKNPAKNIRCLPPNEGKVIFPFLRCPPTPLRHLSQFDVVLAFDEEKRLNQVLRQVFRQRTIGASAIVPVKLKQFGVVSVLAGFPRRV